MDDPKHDRLRRLVDRAKELSNEARQAFLDAECGDDVETRGRLDALLAAAEEQRFPAEATGARPVAPESACEAPVREGPGTSIGPYKLLKLIGEGGFGLVFLAEQERPVARRVALKIIKLGMDTRQVVARFEQERQALALMDHPNIARVIDAGSTDTGRPFFVMDLVTGDPISQYCDANQLTIDQRLELFTQVCGAIHHAHQKGVIHRDIKPSNVLVTTQDGRPVAKVIDFGIAKAMSSKLTDKTLLTEHEQIIGTLQYMSPEQAVGSLDIDTRTDVYSLGVLLYELLTGSTPFDKSTIHDAMVSEIHRMICEVDPPKPSTRISQSADLIAGIAARRGVEPKRLGTIVRGELDWIAMRAVEKDRARRYGSANDLATDIRRYLGGEAVVAAPPGAAYRVGKFIRRHRIVVFSGASVAAALLIGVIAFAWQAKAALTQRDIAEAERDKAEKIAEFMSDMLKGAGPSVARGRDIAMLREMMDGAAARIERGELKSAPEAELRLRGTIGNTYRDLAIYEPAERMLEPAVALARSTHAGDSEGTADALQNLALLRRARGDLARAESLHRESLAMYQRLLGGDTTQIASALNNLGNVLRDSRDLAGAEPLYRESLAMFERLYTGDRPELAAGLGNLAGILYARGDLKSAEPLFRRALEMQKRLHSGDHPAVAAALDNLASLHHSRGDRAAAEPLYRESLDMARRLYSSDHPAVATTLNNLASLLRARGELAEAEPIAREGVEMRRRLFPGDNLDTATALKNLSSLLQDRGNFADAEPFAREALEMWQRHFAGDSPDVANGLSTLARCRQELGRAAEARQGFDASVAMLRRLSPDGSVLLARVLWRSANTHLGSEDAAAALPELEEAVAMAEKFLPAGHPHIQEYRDTLGQCRELIEARKGK